MANGKASSAPTQSKGEAPKGMSESRSARASRAPGPAWSWLARRAADGNAEPREGYWSAPAASARTTLQRACASCEQEQLQRSASGAAPGGIPESVDAVLGDSGAPLDERTRAELEPRFGADLGDVRVHTGAAAAASARDVNAKAYTVGSDIVFGEGRYSPSGGEGRRLLAHEVTHTLQQRGGKGLQPATRGISRPGDSSEHEADSVADAVVSGARAPHVEPSGAKTVAREPAPGVVNVTTGTLEGGWSYIAYRNQHRVKVGRNITSSDMTKRIGSIPWITNNPGNLTVDPEGAASPRIAAREPFKQGASNTQFRPGNGLNYAIFSGADAGEAAIFPVLQRINEGNGGHMSMNGALSVYYSGGGGKSDEGYSTSIRSFMIQDMISKGMAPGDAANKTNAILARPVSSFHDGDEDLEYVLRGLERKEGSSAPPGIEWTCEGGFFANDRSLYTQEQWNAMEKFKSEMGPKLRELAGCDVPIPSTM